MITVFNPLCNLLPSFNDENPCIAAKDFSGQKDVWKNAMERASLAGLSSQSSDKPIPLHRDFNEIRRTRVRLCF